MLKLEELTLDEKIGQLFAGYGHAVFTNESGWRNRDLMHQVRDNKVGGLTWFLSNVFETAFLTQQLQNAARVPLLVSADLEAGVGMRLIDTTYWPTAMAVAATGDPQLAEDLGRITAREAKVLGINHIFAPVADVNVNPDNPVINARSYGEDPHEVSRFVAAFIKGVQSEGVLATAKHFPGHGDTHVDSHRSLPILDVDRARLDRVELVPFRAAVDAGVASVMIGHLAVPSVDPTPAAVRAGTESLRENPYATPEHETTKGGSIPATLSKIMIEDLLRGELGFKGLVVSDAFDMGGLVAHYEAGEAAVLGILAGEDQILKSPNIDAAIAGVKEAVRSGRITEARIDESVRRILDAKSRVSFTVGSQEEIFRVLDAEQHRQKADEIATRALTLLREQPGALPLRRESTAVILTVSDFDEVSNPLAGFAREVNKRLDNVGNVFLLDSRSQADEIAPFLNAARNAETVLLALAVRARSGAGHMALPKVAQDALAQLPPNVRVIGVSFGSPYILRELPALQTYFAAYGIQPVMQQAAVRALFGEAPVSGRLPVTIPGMHVRGEGLKR